ncbi:MAG: SulP family inorganic anion transporter [Lachnospiraceae bacterium]
MDKDKLRPCIISALKGYTKNQFFKDVLAGIIVAVIALPLSIAFAMGAGVSAEKGIFAAVIASIVGAVLGGSRVQISGPTGAFIVITQSVIAQYGTDGLIVAMILAGIMLILMGAFRMGKLIKFIPAPITTGFTAGIGVTIFTLEVKDFLGMEVASVPGKFVEKWSYYFTHFADVNYQAVLLGLVCIVVLVVWPKINKVIPNSFVTLIVGTVLALVLKLDVPLLGEIPKSLGMPYVPHMNLQTIIDLVQPGFTIAILIAMQALLSAVVTDSLINHRTNSNMELIAQGLANVILGIFGCIPATGGVARGIASAKNGARTPIAAIVHSIMLLVFLIFLMPFIKLVPLCVLAAILMVVSYNMFNVKAMLAYRKAPKSDAAVLITSCVLTFAFDLVLAIEVGMILACGLFMKRMSEQSEIKSWKYYDGENDPDSINLRQVPQHVRVYEISGPLFFGAADRIAEITIKDFTRCLVIRMRGVPSLDATAMQALDALYERCHANNVQIIFSHVNEQPYKTMKKNGFIEKIGADNFCKNIDAALERAAGLQ